MCPEQSWEDMEGISFYLMTGLKEIALCMSFSAHSMLFHIDYHLSNIAKSSVGLTDLKLILMPAASGQAIPKVQIDL